VSSENVSATGGGLSRREVLARGAVAAGIVWAAPVIRSSVAYATTNNGTEQPCVNYYFVVIKPSGRCRPPVIPKGVPGHNPSTRPTYKDFETGEDIFHGVDRLPPAIEQWLRDNPAIDLKFPAVCPQLTQKGENAWALLLPEVTGPNAAGRQCRMVIGWSRKSFSYKDSVFAEGYVDPFPPHGIDVGRRLIFPCPPKSQNRESSGRVTSDGAPSAVPGSLGTDGRPVPATTTTTTTTPSASESVSSGGLSASSSAGAQDATDLSGDGSGSGGSSDGGTVSGDGSVSPDTEGASALVSADGRASINQQTGQGACISAVYLIYCCPL